MKYSAVLALLFGTASVQSRVSKDCAYAFGTGEKPWADALDAGDTECFL